MMNREIKLSRRATRKLDNLLVFLENDWSVKVKCDFISKLNKSLEQIRRHPDSFSESDTVKGLRKCVVTKQTTLLYTYTKTTINVVTVFYNRQDPDSLKEETRGRDD